MELRNPHDGARVSAPAPAASLVIVTMMAVLAAAAGFAAVVTALFPALAA